MSQRNPVESLDLSGLPEALRKKVQEQLDRMSPEMQQEFLKKSRPMLNRAMDAAKTVEKKGVEATQLINRIKPHSHYNATIQPGDSGGFAVLRWMAYALLACGVYQIFK